MRSRKRVTQGVIKGVFRGTDNFIQCSERKDMEIYNLDMEKLVTFYFRHEGEG